MKLLLLFVVLVVCLADQHTCHRAASHYFKDCVLNNAPADECATKLASIKSGGCENLLADLETCRADVERLCELQQQQHVRICFCLGSHIQDLSAQCRATEFVQHVQWMDAKMRGSHEQPPQPEAPQTENAAANDETTFAESNDISSSVESTNSAEAPQSVDDGAQPSHHWWGKGRKGHHHKHHRRHCAFHLAVLILASIVGIVGLVWLLRERKRRAAQRAERMKDLPRPQGAWSSGLLGNWDRLAPDWKTCLPSFLFPPFQTALNQAELDDRDVSVADVVLNMSHGHQCVNVYRDRQIIRHQHDIPEAPCADCLASTFCTPCAIAQNAREIAARAAEGQLPPGVVMGKPEKEVV